MTRPATTREPLPFEKRCVTCGHVWDKELFTHAYKPDCDFCLRKAERIAEGLFVLGTSSRSSGAKAHHRRRKLNAEAARMALQNWRRERRAALTKEGILYGDAARVMGDEEPAMRERLGLPSHT